MGIGFELPQSSYPCLRRGVADDKETEEFFIFEEHALSVKIPYLRNKSVFSSRDGWWVLKDHDNEGCIFILNPRSMERIELPKLEYSMDTCILTSSPTNPECHVVLFELGSKNILFCRIGDSEFTYQQLTDIIKYSGPTVVDGKIYCLFADNSMVSLTFEEQILRIRHEPTLVHAQIPLRTTLFRADLIESNNELLSLTMYIAPTSSVTWEVLDVGIHKLDTHTFSWKEVRTIGDHRALFIDDYAGISCNVDEERGGVIKGNRVYYFDSHSHDLVNGFDLKVGCFSVLRIPQSAAKEKPDGEHWFRWISLPAP